MTDVPVCPGCGAVAEWVCDPVLGAMWESVHDDDCDWFHDLDSEPYE